MASEGHPLGAASEGSSSPLPRRFLALPRAAALAHCTDAISRRAVARRRNEQVPLAHAWAGGVGEWRVPKGVPEDDIRAIKPTLPKRL